jgi:organic radical activating enzyme
MKHTPASTECRISEIFSSLQGEGTHVGEKHIFIRFEECHIHCTYCDEDKPGRPMSIEEVVSEVEQLEKTHGPHAFVSLTGGEPLLYVTFLKNLMPRLKAQGLKLYLETNGILWRALEEVIGWCDCVAMDMKPASVTGEKNFYDEHRRFLELCRGKETFVKIVASKEIDLNEFLELVKITSGVAPQTPFILQPISGVIEGHEDPELMEKLAELQQIASRSLSQVRIVPRLHRILKIR